MGRGLRGLMVAALALAAPVCVHLWAEDLGPDGFPKDWKPEDFAPVAVSATVMSKTGVVTLPISALPRVAAESGTVPVLTSESVRVSLSAPVVGPVVPAASIEELPVPPGGLAALDGWGPLVRETGAVSATAWGKVSRSEALVLLNGVSVGGGQSPALREAVTRLLLTPALPAGEISATPGAWLAARAEVLEKLGQDEAAYALWRVVPDSARISDTAMTRGWALASVLAGKVQPPCALARKVIAQGATQPWADMTLACTALDRMSGNLELGLSLAEEQQGTDKDLRALLVAIRDDEAPVKLHGNTPLGALPGAVLATYPALLDSSTLPRLPGVVQRRLVQSAALPLALRARSAELLLQRTPAAANAEAVRVLYEAFTYPPDQVAAALRGAPTLDGTAARALLWQAARMATAVEDKALAWDAFAKRAEKDGMGQVARWLTPARAGIVPVSGTLAVAVPATMAAWRMGDVPTAKAWTVALENAPSPTAAMVRERSRLALAGAVAQGKVEDAAFSQWLVAESVGAGDAAEGRLRVARQLAALEGLGVVLPAKAWSQVDGVFPASLATDEARPMADPVVLSALKDEADAGLLGPALVRLLGWAQQAPVAAWAPGQVQAAVVALKQLGQPALAQALVWEVLEPVTPPKPVTAVKVKAVKAKTPGVTMQNMPGKKAASPMLPPPDKETE
jgi:hypothetical protein